jgi:Transposase DDE domain
VVKKRPRAPDRMQLRAMAMARCVFPVPGGRDRCLGRSRGGLTTKIHALVDKKGRPIKLKLTAGQASDVASAPEMFADLPEDAMLIADKGYDANALRAAVAEKARGRTSRPKPIARIRSASTIISIGRAISSSASSTRSSIFGGSRPATTSSPKTSSPPSNSPPFASGYAIRSHVLAS